MDVATRLTARPPGATDWTTLTGPDGPAAVDAFTVTWHRPTGLSHQEPGTIGFSVLADTGTNEDWAQWDTELYAEVSLDGGAWFPIMRGWATTITRRTLRGNRGNRWLYHVDALDILGRASAARLAALPWPEQRPGYRAQNINAASTVGTLIALFDPKPTTYGSWPLALGMVCARDVDNANALDIIRRTAAAAKTTHETSTGITERGQQGGVARVQASNGPDALRMTSLTTRDTVSIPARLVEDTGRVTDRASRVDTVTFTYPVKDANGDVEERTQTLTAPDRSGASSRLSITTDWLNFELTSSTFQNAMEALLETSAAPARKLIGSPRILVDELPTDALETLIHIDTRGQLLASIGNVPPDLDSLHTILGGKLTILGRRLYLELELMPAILQGIRPLRLSEAVDSTDGRPARLTARTDDLRDLRIGETAAARIHTI